MFWYILFIAHVCKSTKYKNIMKSPRVRIFSRRATIARAHTCKKKWLAGASRGRQSQCAQTRTMGGGGGVQALWRVLLILKSPSGTARSGTLASPSRSRGPEWERHDANARACQNLSVIVWRAAKCAAKCDVIIGKMYAADVFFHPNKLYIKPRENFSQRKGSRFCDGAHVVCVCVHASIPYTEHTYTHTHHTSSVVQARRSAYA